MLTNLAGQDIHALRCWAGMPLPNLAPMYVVHAGVSVLPIKRPSSIGALSKTLVNWLRLVLSLIVSAKACRCAVRALAQRSRAVSQLPAPVNEHRCSSNFTHTHPVTLLNDTPLESRWHCPGRRAQSLAFLFAHRGRGQYHRRGYGSRKDGRKRYHSGVDDRADNPTSWQLASAFIAIDRVPTRSVWLWRGRTGVQRVFRGVEASAATGGAGRPA